MLESVVFGGVVPHPPIMLPEIGGPDANKVIATQQAMNQLAAQIRESGAESLVIISPHGPVFQDAIAINGSESLQGNLGNFGHSELKFTLTNELTLAKEIVNIANQAGLTSVIIDEELAETYGVSLALDHGVLVPLYFLERGGVNLPTVSITMGLLPFEELYQFGTVILKAASKLGKKVAVLASGDLSHRLTEDAPAGYSPAGIEFDEQIVAGIRKGSLEKLISISHDCIESAGECGMRPILMMLGSMDGHQLKSEVLSYEGPFGVGYMVAHIQPGPKGESLVQDLYQKRLNVVNLGRESEGPLVKLARHSLETYIIEGKQISQPVKLDDLMEEEHGVFVSIKKHGQLRGCIGTIMPTYENVAQEVINNAIQAGTQDPRFWPVEVDELNELTYSVDVLMPPEPIENVRDLNVLQYGVIVRSGRKTGLLLPNLEGIETVGEQLKIAKEKAGIGPAEPFTMERFEVIRYK